MLTPVRNFSPQPTFWRRLALLLSLVLGSLGARAQIDTYQFAATSSTFTPLTGGTSVAILGDDLLAIGLPLGFTFQLDGVSYTTVTASSNGYLSFGTAPANTSYNNALSTTYAPGDKPLLAAYWDDLTGSGGGSPVASYLTTGTAPNRVFTFEWFNWTRLGVTGPTFSMQAKLFEGTNAIQFIYRPEANTLTTATASIGLAGPVVGTTAPSFLSVSAPTATATVSSTVENASIATVPPAGQVYTFTPAPPSPCATPRNLTTTGITATSAGVSWTVNGGTGPFTIQYGPTGFNPAIASSSTNFYTTITSATTSATLNGLTASTGYQFYVTQNCGGTNGDSNRSNAGSFQSACINPLYATLPFLEDFEGTWISRCDTREVPTNFWRNTPATGNLSWRRDDDGASANWSNSFGNFTIPASQGLHTARFHDYSASTATGLLSTFDLFINLSTTGNKVLQFDYINVNGTDSLQVQVSTDGGLTFGAPLLRLGVVAAFATQSVSLPAANSATTVIRFQAKTDLFGSSDIGLDNVRVAALTAAPGCVTGVTPASGATGVVRPLTITWTPGTGITTGYDIYFGTTATPPLVASNQPANSYSPTVNLASNTTYYFQIVPRNGVGPATGCTVYSFTTGTLFNYCTTNLGGFCGSSEISAVNVSGSGLNSTGLACTTTTNGAYQALPASGNNTGTVLRGVSYQVQVTVTSSSIVSVWIDFNQNGSFEATEWTQITTNGTGLVSATIQIPLTAALGQTGMRVRSRGNGNQNGAGDACLNFGSGETKDFTITVGPAPACPPPSALIASAVTTTSATLAYTAAGTGTYTLVYGPIGFDPTQPSSTTNVYTTVTNATTSTAITGLTPGVTYQYYVQQNCGAAGLSQNTGPTNFTTLIVNDDPCGATLLTVNNTCTPLSTTTAGATTTAPNGYTNPGTCGGGNATPLDVWFRFTTAATGPTSTAVRISVTGAPASVVRGFSGAACTGPLTSLSCVGTSATAAAPNLDLTNLTPNTTYYVSVSNYSSFTFTLGNFTICASPVPNCPAPTALTASNVTNTTATLSWAGTAGSTYTVIYGPTGFTPPTGGTTISGLTTTTTTLTGLTPNTPYQFYVQQVCGGFNGSSVLAGPIAFTTPLTAPSNDEPCGAIGVQPNATVTGSTVGATTTTSPVSIALTLPTCSGASQPKDVWYVFTPSTTSTTLTFTGATVGAVRVFSLSGTCSAGTYTQFTCQAAASAGTSLTTATLTGLTVGTRYYLAISGYASTTATGTFTASGTSLLPTANRAQAETNALVVYPNPSNTGQLTLRLSTPTAGSATLLNALGQVVLTKNLTVGTTEQLLSTKGLATGVYTLRVQQGNDVLTRKVVLE